MNKAYEVYDVLTGQTMMLDRKNCQEYMTWQQVRMLGRHKCYSVNDRFISPINKSKLFILIDFDTVKEYECITNKTIFLHLGIPYHEPTAKCVSELKRQHCNFISVGNHLFSLKGKKMKRNYPVAATTATSIRIAKIRQHNKIKFKLRARLRNRLLKAIGRQKSESITKLIGCSLDEFIIHIERQFKQGMTWENQGKWHIDHIKPCALFDLFNVQEQAECFHYTNLQPLWAADNIKKRDHYPVTNPDNH